MSGTFCPKGPEGAAHKRCLTPCCAQKDTLPDGKGIEKVRLHCSLCHGLELVAQQRLNQAEWARVVDQMVEFGAPLAPSDRREIMEYLTAYLGAEDRRR